MSNTNKEIELLNTLEFLSYLRSLDVEITVDKDKLRCRARDVVLTPTLQAQLAGRKADILSILGSVNTNANSQYLPILPTSRDKNLPLSFAQTRLWFLDQLEPDSSTYNIPAAYRLTGVLNIAALEQSLNEIVQRHEVLRTTFRSVDGQPSQFIVLSMGFTLPIVDLRDRPENEKEAIAQQIANEAAQQPFNLATDPLFRFKFLRLREAESLLLLNMHHIVSDGWSFDVFFQELTALYTAFSTNKPSPHPSLPIQYADFAVWQRNWLQGEVLDSQLNYWKQQLKGNLPVLQLPTDFPRPKVQTYRGAHQTRSLSPDLSQALKALSQREGVTLFMTLLAAFKILLYRYSGQTDIIVGTPIAGRNRKEIEELIGFFVNSLVLRTNLEDGPNFRELLGRVRQVTLGAYAHQDLPFEKLVEELQPERDPLRTPLFQVWFNMINLADTKLELPGLIVERLENQETPSKFDLTFYIREKTHGIELELVYNAELFAPERMVEMLHQFQHLLLQIVESPEETIAGFSLVTAKAELLLPNPSQTLTPAWEGAVHTRFSRQARLVPKHLAVVDAQVAWSYAELEPSANQLANYLLGNGIGSQDIVAIYGHRSASLVWAVLGVLKVGAAFFILDPAYPVAHLIDRLCIAKPQGWLQLETDSSLPTDLEEFVKTLSCCSLQLPQGSIALAGEILKEYSTKDPAVAVAPDDLAYVTFTSGTTGKPKGILGTHRPLSHFLQWHCQSFDLNQSDRFSLLSGLSHDPLLRDIFTPLWLGATLCIPEPKDIETPGRLTQWMWQQKVSITHLTPAMGQLLTENTLTTSEILSLRYVFFGGDLLTKGDVAKISKLAPTATCVNFYGATETPQAMGYFPLCNSFEKNRHSYLESLQESIPLGRGIEGVQLLILNTVQQLAGIGEVGEIYIRTPYLAKGYIGDEQLTQERFILNPFTKTIGDRLYKTGDLARYLPDGNIEFIGRIDNQVKIRGFRIELGEVESTLSQYPAVRQCAVTARIDTDSDKRLVAYIVINQQQKPTADELRRFLKQKLPDYMVPSAFVFPDALPLTPNGKIDRRALAAPDRLRQEPASTFAPPSDDLEIQLTKIWENVLGKKPIGVKDNFFDLGGHSLLAVRLFAQIEKTFGKNLPLATLFQAPNIEELASILRQKGWSAPWQTLVAIQPGGSKPPLFCIHPIGGNVLCYHTLAHYLGEQQPVYGIQAVGLDGKQAPYKRAEDMAARYIREIRAFQPEGPYLLAGHSSAGMVAFEIAQQLVAQGQKVAVLALLDAYSPKLFVREVPPGRTLYINLLNLLRLRPKDKLAYIKQRAVWLRGRISNKIAKTFNRGIGHPLTQDSHPYALITEAFSQAMKDYVPQVYPGQATLFRTRHQPTRVYYEPQFGWGSLVAGGLEIHDVPGLHLTLLTEPCVQVLGEKLRACIDEAIT